MKKICKFILLIAILFIIEIILNTTKVKAASATLTGDKTVNKGETVTVTANVTAGAWNLTLSGAGKTEGFVGQTSKTSNENASKSITFTASEVGTYKITLKGDITDYDTDANSTIDKTTTITVKEANNNNGGNTTSTEPKKGTVTSCYINTVKVNEFLNVKNKDSVPVKVNTSTNEGLTIYNNKTKKSYTAKSGATTNVQIVEGEQTLTITLNTGYKTTRRVISIKEGEEVKPNVIDETPKEEEIKVILKSLTIKGVTIVQLEGEEEPREHKVNLELSPEFSSEVYEYKVTIPEELNDITKLDITALGDKEDFTIDIEGNEEIAYGENIVTIIVKSKDGTKKQEYKITVEKESKTEEIIAPVAHVDEEPQPEEKIPAKLIKNIIIIVTLVALIAGVVFAVVEYKYTNKPKSAFEDVAYGTIEFEEEINENNENFGVEETIEDDEYEESRLRKRGKHF